MAFNTTLGPGGPTSLNKVLSLPDPLLSFKWVCLSMPFDFPLHYVESVDIPWLNIAIDEKQHTGSSFTYFPGNHDISAFSVTLYEDRKATSLKFIWGWKKRVKNFDTGIYNLPDDETNGYKKNMVFRYLDQKNNPIFDVTMMGCWPGDTNNWSANYTDSGRVTLSQTFSIDSQTLKFY
jgi:hypothetical protein